MEPRQADPLPELGVEVSGRRVSRAWRMVLLGSPQPPFPAAAVLVVRWVHSRAHRSLLINCPLVAFRRIRGLGRQCFVGKPRDDSALWRGPVQRQPPPGRRAGGKGRLSCQSRAAGIRSWRGAHLLLSGKPVQAAASLYPLCLLEAGVGQISLHVKVAPLCPLPLHP